MKINYLWYWVRDEVFGHPFKRVKLAFYDPQTEERTYEDAGLMAMDDFGNLVNVSPGPL